MVYTLTVLFWGFLLGVIAVSSNPCPFFAALGLSVAAGMACGLLAGYGGPFLSLVLFLIYLGGMLVVFAYSMAFAAEEYPETWWSWRVGGGVAFYMGVAIAAFGLCREGWDENSEVVVDGFGGLFMVQEETGGVAFMYSAGGGVLIISAWELLIALFAVVEVTRGLSQGGLRAP